MCEERRERAWDAGGKEGEWAGRGGGSRNDIGRYLREGKLRKEETFGQNCEAAWWRAVQKTALRGVANPPRSFLSQR